MDLSVGHDLGVVLKRHVRSVRQNRIVFRLRRHMGMHLVMLSPQTRRHLLVAVHISEEKRRGWKWPLLCPLGIMKINEVLLERQLNNRKNRILAFRAL